MKGLATGFVKRPIGALMLLLTLAVIGSIAYMRIPLQLVPAGLAFPNIWVDIPIVESTPEEVMERVARPVEEMFRTIPGVIGLGSRSSGDHCGIRVRCDPTVDGNAIYADLRDRMERLLPALPNGADRYRIHRFNPETDIPVMNVAVTHDRSVKNPDALLEHVIKPRLEAMPGVAQVEVEGLIERRAVIELDPARVRAYGVDVAALITRLSGDNAIAPCGIVRDGGHRLLVRTASRFESFDELRSFPVNESLTLGEIAEIGYQRAVQEFIVRVDQELCYSVEISKQSEANTVDVCTRLEELFEVGFASDARLAGFKYHPYFSQGRIIRHSLGSVEEACRWGGLFAIAVLFLFLRRVGITLVVAAAIPLSLLITVVVIYFQGGTFNIMSLMGLTLAVGMLVDNAIVIAESIFRERQCGTAPRAAAYHGTREVALAVTLGTLTTVAAFVPVIYVSGDSMVRTFLAEIGLPVSYSVLASLAVALLFVPVATTFLSLAPARPRSELDSGWFRRWSGAGAMSPEGRTARGYRCALSWMLRHRFAAALISLLVFLTIQIPKQQVAERSGDEERTHGIELDVDFPRQNTLAETDDAVCAIQRAVAPHHKELEIEVAVAWFGSRRGTIAFFLEPQARVTRGEMMRKLKPLFPELPGVSMHLEDREEENATSTELRVAAVGRDPAVLAGLLQAVAENLRGLPGIIDVAAPRDASFDEILVHVDREVAQRYRVNSARAAEVVGWSLRGTPLADFVQPSEEVPLWVEFMGRAMENIDDLYQVQVYSDAGVPVPLANVASFAQQKGVPSISRREGLVRQALRITTDPDIEARSVVAYVQGLFSKLDVPEGYKLQMDEPRDEEGDFKELALAGFLALVLIFVIMGVLFESVLLPFSVLCSFPHMFVGSFWLLWAFDESISPLAAIGFILLLGVVVNNAIVLIDCVNRRRAQGLERGAAILEAGGLRLRPIAMTALTTMFGLAPLIVFPQTGEGIDYRPLAIVVFGGLSVSTVLTLFVVPLFYTLFDDLQAAIRRISRGTMEWLSQLTRFTRPRPEHEGVR